MKHVPVRCLKCKKRKTVRFDFKDFEFNKKGPKCTCGHRKFFLDKWMLKRGTEQKCMCEGYHFPHRKGSPHCRENPMEPYNTAKNRYGIIGDDLVAVLLDCMWESEGGKVVSEEVPF